MNKPSLVETSLRHPRSQAAFRNVKTLVGGYLGMSVLTLVAIALLRDNPALVTPAVWVRGTIVVASALLMTLFAALMARGTRRGYILLWLASAIMVVAIAVIIAIPGDFPLWFKIEQGVCGLLLIGVVIILSGKHLRTMFVTR